MARTRHAGKRVNINARSESRSVPIARTHRDVRVTPKMKIGGTVAEVPDPTGKAPDGGGLSDMRRYKPNCNTQSNPNIRVDLTDHRSYKEERRQDGQCEVGTSCVILTTANIGLPRSQSLVMPPRTMSVVGWESGKCEMLEIPRGHKTPCLPLPPGVDFYETTVVAELLDMLAGQATLIFNLCMDGHREVVAKRALQLENQRMRGLLKTTMGQGIDCVWMGIDWQDFATLQEARTTMQSSPTVNQNGNEEKMQALGRIDNISCYPSGDDDIGEGNGVGVYSDDSYFVDAYDNHNITFGGISFGGNEHQRDGSTGPARKKHVLGGAIGSLTDRVGKLGEKSGDSGGNNNGHSTRSRSTAATARRSKRLKRGV